MELDFFYVFTEIITVLEFWLIYNSTVLKLRTSRTQELSLIFKCK